MKSGFFLEERHTLIAGFLGLGGVVFGACAGGDGGSVSTEPTPNASASSQAEDNAEADAGKSPAAVLGCKSDPATGENTAVVVGAAMLLLAELTPEQQTGISYELTLANAQQWSNFPTTFVARNGVRFGDMSASAQGAAYALAAAAAGNKGTTQLLELRDADEFLVTDGKASATDYGRGLFYFSIHGTPATDSAWMLQIAGHHLAYNFMYNGPCTSGTPLFDGVEPTTWEDEDGKQHAPLESQRAAVVELLTSVAAVPEAKLSGTFGDLVNGPGGGGAPGGGAPGGAGAMGGGGDTKYPSSLVYPSGSDGRGVNVSTLSAEQVTLVKTAIESWVKNVADPVSKALLAEYESEEALKETYVGYAGAADLKTQGSYFRVDGPRVWIELTVQGGIVYRDRVHYHTIWRDKVADYGAEFASP